jgi:CarD family transcriptional regulator
MTAKKPAAKPAKGKKPAAKAKRPPAKPAPSARRPAPAAADKPAARTAKPLKKAPAAKATLTTPDSAKAAAKPAKGVPSNSAKKATPPGKPGATAKAPPRKKLNVGQKPRTEKADLPLRPQSFAAARDDLETPGLKPSPASKEAKQTFKVNDYVVYPAHGVGRIVGIEKQHIAGVTNELFVIDFEQEKMKLRVPTAKALSVGMRGLAEEAQVKRAIDVLKGRARIKRTMWSRRAQEYEAKINSGDIIAVAEVVRDLYRATDQPEQSYSERQLFEAALDRLAREVAAVRRVELGKALGDLDSALQQKKAA